MVELGQDLSFIAITCGIWAAPPAQPEELWMFVVDLGQDLSLLQSPVEFGQRLRRNLKIVGVCGQIRMRLVINCVCMWNLGSASGVT